MVLVQRCVPLALHRNAITTLKHTIRVKLTCLTSVNLFLIVLRSITSCIEDTQVKIIGYADDWTIYLAHANMAATWTKLQDTVDNLESWSEQNGFRFSQTKTVMIHFCRLRPRRNPHVDPKISLKGHDIKLVDSY
jgi:hypothetical protein